MNFKLNKSVILPVAAAFVWGMAFSAQEICSEHLGAFSTNAIRNLLAGVALIPVVLSFRSKQNKKAPFFSKDLLIGSSLCGLIMCAALTLQQSGMSLGTDSGKAGFLTAMYVVIVPLLEIFLGKKAPGRIWFCVALAIIGLYLLSVKETYTIDPGDILLIINAFLFAVHILVVSHFTKTCEPVSLACFQFLFASLFSFLGMIVTLDFDFSGLSGCWQQLVYLGVISSAVGFTLQIIAQKGANPTLVTLLLCLESVFAAIGGAVFLGQVMSMREYLGCAIMFAAVIISQLPQKQPS
jgi:drug/metabolite transporter (DMT)-like permease